jgi:hypothetical protein
MILALLDLLLRLTANPDGGHLEIVWHGGLLVHIWCFCKNLNHDIPKLPD